VFGIRELPARKRFRLILRAIFITVGVVGAFVTSALLENKAFTWAIVPASFVLLASMAEFVLADVLTERRYPASTEGLLQRLEANLRGVHDPLLDSISGAIQSLRACDIRRVSGTFHLKVELYSQDGDEAEPALVQVTDYSGRLGGKRWRFTSATKGVVGRCLRTGCPEWVNFASSSEYEHCMVREFGFSPSEVATHTRDARSYWAQPVFSRSQLVGVMYLFSTEIQVFPHAADPAILEAAARQIAACLESAGIV